MALARALAIRPSLLLMDEPLSNLDATLRAEVAREIRILQRENHLTALMVTHDQAEAMAMADRLVVMREGRVEQSGSQEEICTNVLQPLSLRVHYWSEQHLAGRLHDGDRLVLEDGSALRLACRYGHVGICQLSLRPERISVVAQVNEQAPARGIMELSTYLGASVEHVVRLGAQSLVIRTGI